MDTNELLKKVRDLAEDVRQIELDMIGDLSSTAGQLAVKVRELDTKLSGGDPLPEEWSDDEQKLNLSADEVETLLALREGRYGVVRLSGR